MLGRPPKRTRVKFDVDEINRCSCADINERSAPQPRALGPPAEFDVTLSPSFIQLRLCLRMSFSRFFRIMRFTSVTLASVMAGVFVLIGAAALTWGYVPPEAVRLSGSLVLIAGILTTAWAILINRRRGQRRSSARTSNSPDRRR